MYSLIQTFYAASGGEYNPKAFNYIDAMNFGLEKLDEIPVSLRLIRMIHDVLLRDVRGAEKSPGRFRKSQNWVGPEGCTKQTASYVPPPAHIMKDSLNDFENFLHDKNPLPLLFKVGLAHAQFETIHPFGDGNGRIGRLLITFMLCEKEVIKRPLLYLSFYFKQHKKEYYDRLQAIREQGDWEGWIKFFLRGVFEVSQEATETARKIVSLRETHRKLVATKLGGRAGNALILLENLFWRPIVSVKHAANVTNLTYPNASIIVNKFVEIGLIGERKKRKRGRKFYYEPYLALFGQTSP